MKTKVEQTLKWDQEGCYFVFRELAYTYQLAGSREVSESEAEQTYELLRALMNLADMYALLSDGDNAWERFERNEYGS